MNLKNRKLILNGKWHAFLAEKPTPIPNRSIYLLSTLGKEPDYSLWLIETDEDEQNFSLWSYEGTDSKELIMELVEEFIATALD
jgi:hypothetical protein